MWQGVKVFVSFYFQSLTKKLKYDKSDDSAGNSQESDSPHDDVKMVKNEDDVQNHSSYFTWTS